MPIRSQHTAMSFEEWKLQPHPPGWKHEYYDGCGHITASHQGVVTTVPVAARPVAAPCGLRDVREEDEVPLLDVYLEAFADNQAFCDYSDLEYIKAARADLHDSFGGRRAPLLAASRLAVTTIETGGRMVGAALLSRDRAYGPVLDLLFISSSWQRRGLATALVASAMNVLHQDGDGSLTSTYQLANSPSQAWHRSFGFVEQPDLRYALAYYRYFHHELDRLDRLGALTDPERAKLEAEVAHWRERVEALERLSDEQGYSAVYPRLPHS